MITYLFSNLSPLCMENDKRMDTYVKNNDNIICEFTTDLLDFVVISQHSKKNDTVFVNSTDIRLHCYFPVQPGTLICSAIFFPWKR